MGEIAVFLKDLDESRAVQNDTKEFAALLNKDEFEMVDEQLKMRTTEKVVFLMSYRTEIFV